MIEETAATSWNVAELSAIPAERSAVFRRIGRPVTEPFKHQAKAGPLAKSGDQVLRPGHEACRESAVDPASGVPPNLLRDELLQRLTACGAPAPRSTFVCAAFSFARSPFRSE